MSDLTVLAPQNDPFRCDTPAGHRDGAWVRDTLDQLGIGGQRHLRGLHYALIGQPKPNGLPYTNTDPDWQWLASAAKSARWLGYLPMDRIVDHRNDAPEIREYKPADPSPWISVDFDVHVPDHDDLRPYVGVSDFNGIQPYHLALVGEKSSLKEVLAGVADTYHADLYLPTGEMSDTMAHTMAKSVQNRPLVVFYFADCDPAGWQMPVSLARKLQALKVLHFSELQFQVHRVGLTPEQVQRHGLPSTPLKDTERRADKWRAAMGVQQTEIDALAALQPELLRQVAHDALDPYFDHTLAHRVWLARSEWQHRAQTILDAQDGDDLRQLRVDAANQLDEKHDEIRQILDTVRVDAGRYKFPTPVVPAPRLDPTKPHPLPLCDSGWDFAEQCRALKRSKAYGDGEGVTTDG